MSKNKIIELQKGGVVVDTSEGGIQIGVPSETIKDSMELKREVPSIYIAPKHLFSSKRMANLIDIEFPIYYNFYSKRIKTIVICTEEQKDVVKDLFKESFYGPERMNIQYEYENGADNKYYPDLKKEMDYFCTINNKKIEIDQLLDVKTFDENSICLCRNIKIKLDKESEKIIIDDGDEYIVDWNQDYTDFNLEDIDSREVFIPPNFGITTLGASHGFDPKGRTSGFIFWINGSGIFVDPPLDSSIWLIRENVDPRMVNSVILTHCHADHDSGVMQKVLQEGRIILYTTPTIFSSFIRKVSLLTDLSELDIIDLIEFIPVTIGSYININGAKFRFSYRLHSIPTIGFEVSFKRKSVVYTSDHLNDKKFFDKLHKDGILTDGRYEELTKFSWDKDYIIHEAGVPPLHTPLETLLKLDRKIQNNIYLVHTDATKLPKDSKLTISKTGLSNTQIFDVPIYIHDESVQILKLLNGIELFNDIVFSKTGELLSIINYRKFNAGDCMIKEGSTSKRFFIIIAGKAKLIEKGKSKAVLTSGAYFGENTLINKTISIDTIIALTELICITIDRDDFLHFITNTSIYEKLKRLSQVRNLESWDVLQKNQYFKEMTINQKNNLELIFEYFEVNKGDYIIKYGNPLEYAIIWKSGEGIITDKDDKEIRHVERGDFFGVPAYLVGEKMPKNNLIAKGRCSYFRIHWDKMQQFFQHNPRIFMELRNKDLFDK